MSGNKRKRTTPAVKPKRKRRLTDARVKRTQQRLGSALVELIHEKPIAQITVEDVLHRAGVGRSTFYLHFRDKNDLLLTQLETFLELMSTTLSVRKDRSRRIAPVKEMLEHIGGQNKIYIALMQAGKLDDFYALAQEYFARGIERRLKELSFASTNKSTLAARSVALSGSLLSLLRWWIDRGARQDPQEIDNLFHQMVWHGLE